MALPPSMCNCTCRLPCRSAQGHLATPHGPHLPRQYPAIYQPKIGCRHPRRCRAPWLGSATDRSRRACSDLGSSGENSVATREAPPLQAAARARQSAAGFTSRHELQRRAEPVARRRRNGAAARRSGGVRYERPRSTSAPLMPA